MKYELYESDQLNIYEIFSSVVFLYIIFSYVLYILLTQ